MIARSKVKRYGSSGPYRRIYLLAPRHPVNFWSMQGTAELFGTKTLMPNAALATLMALTPDDVSVEYALADENVTEIDTDFPCDLVAITGSTIHAPRIHELCEAFKKRGIPVALGGTYASIESDRCQGLADYLFIGEAEYTWPLFLRQWSQGKAQAVYHQKDPIDLTQSPAPDWSLIRQSDYLNMTVQTSRGCPNNCDFCQVIQYLGRRYRTKSIQQILSEVKQAHALGAHTVFFSDDNFLGKPAFTRQLLDALIQWNSTLTKPLSFSTQITMQVADDDALLKKFADARFSVLFVGVETVRRESLEEIHKTQNLSKDPIERIKKISRFGIVPFLGLIVGFDNDDSSVFDDLYHFIDITDSPIAGISLLNAPRKTPLYERLSAQGRIVNEEFGGEWQLSTNIIPKKMSRQELERLYWSLFEKIYEPEKLDRRLAAWLSQVQFFTRIYTRKKFDPRQISNLLRMFKHFTLNAEPEVRSLFFRSIRRTWRTNPKLIKRLFTLLAQYWHFYDFIKTNGTTAVST